jgi:hypothetical protein
MAIASVRQAPLYDRPMLPADLVVRFGALLAHEIEAALTEPGYLGSIDQLDSLSAFVHMLAPDVVVDWGPATFWEPNFLSIKQPGQESPEREAEVVTFGVLHEALHAVYTDSPDLLPAYQRLHDFENEADPDVGRVAGAAYNWLEDERVSRLTIAEAPALRTALEGFADDALKAHESGYAALLGESPWTDDPARPARQFELALSEQIFGRGRASTTKGTVANLRTEVAPLVDAALGGTSCDVIDSAINIATVYRDRRPL